MASSGESTFNEHGLSTVECFNFLLKLSQDHPDEVIVSFMGSYDTEMMLKDVPKDVLRKMYESRDNNPSRHPTHFKLDDGKEYAISYLPRKSFTVRVAKNPPYKETGRDAYGYPILEKNYDSVTMYDIFDFFQCRFVDALGDIKRSYFTEYLHQELIDGIYHEIITWPDGFSIDLTHMKAMKNTRSSFTLNQLEEIISYCRDEVIAIQRLAERLKDYLEEADLLPFQSRWLGPGACTNTLLQREHVKDYMHEGMPLGFVRELRDAQLRAYSAGRMELGKFGVYIGKVWHYDLHSAFPSVMPLLPSLTDGRWRHVQGISSKPYSLTHVRWDFDGNLPFFPFFYRDFHGGIYYPGTGDGWYWKPEVDAALRAMDDGKLSTKEWKGSLNIIESWEFHPQNDTKPFAFIPGLFQLRKLWKELGNAAEKAIKFTINSIYGKIIQSRGWSTDSQGFIVKPTYYNAGYAGYITSYIRAKMFDAIMQSPENVVTVLIDGLYSSTKLNLPTGEGLGEWGETEYDGIISVQSGIYFSLKKLGREPTEQERQVEFFDEKFLYYDNEWYKVSPHYQGYNKGTITPKMVIEKWNDPGADVHPDNQSIIIPTKRFVTLASVMSNEELWPYWRTIDRKLEMLPTGKRFGPLTFGKARAHERLVGTKSDMPYGAQLDEISYKYKPKWDDSEDYSIIDGIDAMLFNQEVMDNEM